MSTNNGLAGIKQLFDVAGIQASAQETTGMAAFLGRAASEFKTLAGLVPRADGSLGGLQQNLGLPNRFWNVSYARFCPMCLGESGVWSSHWELALVVACPIHRVKLIDRCNNCQGFIRWHRRQLMQCSCGQNLSELSADKCTDIEIRLADIQMKQCVQSRLPETISIELLANLDLAELSFLLWFIGAYSSGLSVNKPLKISGIYQINVASQLVNAAGYILSDWPFHFHQFLYQLGNFGESEISSKGLRKRFGFFYDSLYKEFSEPQFSFLHHAFEQFLHDNWNGAFAYRNRRLSNSLIEAHRMLPLATVSRMLHISRVSVERLINSGQLVATVKITPKGRRVMTIDRQSVNQLQEKWAGQISFNEARSLLGLSKKKFRSLLDKEVIKAESGPKIDGSSVWKFSKSAIESALRKG